MNLVQPIVLMTPTSHEDAVDAVAVASYQSYERTGSDLPQWDEWLDGSFTKSVRRAKTSKFWSLVEELEPPVVRCGGDYAFALPPAAYEDFPPQVKRLQVSGTVAPFTRLNRPPQPGRASIAVNDSLGMSTGKEAAQVAHAYWMGRLSGVFDSIPPIDRLDHKTFTALSLGRVIVRDSGLTEFDKPTVTCVLLT